jgi:uncharacterized protein YbjT (DUF2867 family)
VPVVIVGPSGSLGRSLIPRLVEAGSEVRAVEPREAAADPLRQLGAKVAVGDPGNPELLPAVLRDAHTLCVLLEGLFLTDTEYGPVIADTVQAGVEGAQEAGLARILLLSFPGADPGSANAFLRAKGMAEQAVKDSGIEHVILRPTLILARESPWLFLFGGGGARRLPFTPLIGPGTQRLAPVFVEDVASVLAVADDRAKAVTGTFGLQGPDEVSADELAELFAGGRRRWGHLSSGAATRVVKLGKRRLTRAAAEILASDSLADAPDAAAEFGVKLTPLREALRKLGFDTV